MTETVHTIADVARLAGVSKATVSRALNDSPLISRETKDRIRAIAREHEFRMNVPARRLSLQESGTIALVTYGGGHGDIVPDSFMVEIMSGISAALHASDHDLLLVNVDRNDTEWPRRYVETGRADGFVLLEAICTREQLRLLVEQHMPFIVWGAPAPGQEYSSVSGDNVAGGRLAAAHLLRSGRTRVAFLGGPAADREVRQRYEGYTAALLEAGRPVDPALVVHTRWEGAGKSSAPAVTALLERAPDLDAVFANSDRMAITAMDVLRAHGRRVPDDVAVVGYDDIAIARFASPPLTTIRQNGPLAGRLLAENLIRHLQTGVVTSVSIPAELVVRESAP